VVSVAVLASDFDFSHAGLRNEFRHITRKGEQRMRLQVWKTGLVVLVTAALIIYHRSGDWRHGRGADRKLHG